MITELFSPNKSTLSFEVFPPKKDDEFDNVFEILNEMAKLSPDFISVTFGAGGSKSKKTIEIASYIQNNLSIPALAHMTCVGYKKADLELACKQLKESGIQNVLALRGDRPAWMEDEVYTSREFLHATDMMTYLKDNTDFTIAGACYPEKHYEAVSFDEDLMYLKKKQDSGASFFISQLFFDNELFYLFLDRAKAAGITIPIFPGILPITSAKQLGTTVSLSGSSVPKSLSDLIATYGDDNASMRSAGIDYAINQIRDLKSHKVDGIHIYTMNKPKVAKEIVSGIA